jgi:excisionase family DNA binding protein
MSAPVSSPPLLSFMEAADRLGIHISTLHRWINKGIGPRSIVLGERRRFPADAVEEYLREGRKDVA